MHEILPSRPTIEQYELPRDAQWQSIDDVADDLIDITTLHMMAGSLAETIDEVVVPYVTLDDIYEVYDDWSSNEQQIVVARSEDDRIVGMVSYYMRPESEPFMESVAVHPDAQGSGIGMELIAVAIENIARTTDAEYVVAQAQERVAHIYERKLGAVSVASAAHLVTMHVDIVR